MNKIAETLIKSFEKHRIIFWYDAKVELKDQFDELEIAGVKKVHVQDNQFEIKYQISKQFPTDKFLLYFDVDKPSNEDNWLLDLELAHHLFHTDLEASFLQEMGLEYHFKELVSEHIEFFKAKTRRLKLKEMLGVGDKHRDIKYKMLTLVFATENVSFRTFIHAHASAYADGNSKYEKDLERYNLTDFYWGELDRKFNYQNDQPSIYDFLLEIFNKNFCLIVNSDIPKESRLLLSLWKDSIQYRGSFGSISDRIALDIDIESKLNEASLEEIIGDDLFKLSDLKVIHDLVDLINLESISNDKVSQLIKQRENKFWYDDYSALYKSLAVASELIAMVRKYSASSYDTISEGVEHYASTLYEIDQLYRKFIWNYRRSNQNKILADLAKKVEKVYTNDWLLTFSNNWQSVIDQLDVWPSDTRKSQNKFFDTHVKPFTKKKQRLFVIISDALRYECGEELTKRLQAEKRYEASIDCMLSTLPSYTQLGMAAMLPHKELAMHKKSDTVDADGMSTIGIQGRTKVLAVNSGVRATAVKAEDFMKMNSSQEGRRFVKEYDLIYIYHNRIDKTGDDKTSEERVFEAVEDELQFLAELVKKIGNMNGINMMITSDHGFLFQHNELAESDYCTWNHRGEVWKENRRFVIGEGLGGDSACKSFKGKDLNVASDIDVLIPKSINRLRIKGSGSRFIHGGASLQEIVIPLIKVSKKKQDTIDMVDIDIIKTSDKITTNILSISFLQSDLVSEQFLPRPIRAAIYAEDGELLSDQFKYNFDIEEGSERMREVKHSFQMSAKASGKYKNQSVKLILEEPVEGSNKWKEYKNYLYTLNISFTNDFDF